MPVTTIRGREISLHLERYFGRLIMILLPSSFTSTRGSNFALSMISITKSLFLCYRVSSSALGRWRRLDEGRKETVRVGTWNQERERERKVRFTQCDEANEVKST